MSEALSKEECAYHRDNAEGVCEGCKEPIDAYGNTAYDFKYCSFPDCGCDGARLCMAGNPNNASMAMNFEMGSLKR